MLCLVRLPNDFLLEVTLGPRARGQECLDKVCEKLNTIEVDLFGLQFKNKNGDRYWLNLRNMIRQQIHVQPIRLVFKLKFYVPPHLIQQQSTRHLFYLNIRASLREKQLKVTDAGKQAKLIALIAQAELGNYRSDSIDLKQLYSEWILLFDSPSPAASASASEEQHQQQTVICQQSVEVQSENDSSNQPASSSSESGARKRRKHHSDSSVAGITAAEDEATEEEEVEVNTAVQFAAGSTGGPSTSTNISASAPDLICHSISVISIDSNQQQQSPPPPQHLSTPVHAQFYRSIVEHHIQLQDCLPSNAENKLLEEMVDLEDIGIDFFSACDCDGQGKCTIGVGTRGVTIGHTEAPVVEKKITYVALVKVRTSTNFFMMKYIEEDGEVTERKFRLSSTKSANALYRIITEKHVFYSCDTVRDSVTTQCVIGLTGMFWSITPAIFKDDPEVGKNFVFDIRRTLRQFYDDVQRTMFKLRNQLEGNLHLLISDAAADECEQMTTESRPKSSTSSTDQSNEEKLQCRICFDRCIEIVFMPCCHANCCERCSADCDNCPLCRAVVNDKLKIFL